MTSARRIAWLWYACDVSGTRDPGLEGTDRAPRVAGDAHLAHGDTGPASPLRLHEGPVSTPREAATVVVRRPAPDGGPHELYVIRRSPKSPFMPSTIVFPGGRVDTGDGAFDDDDRFVRAAIREAAEEAHLDLTGASLLWFDTWLTPSLEARRYLARFFVADVERARGEDARPDGHEAVDGAWMRSTALLDAWDRGELDLPPPTLSILRWLASAPDLDAAMDDEELALPILPKVVAHGAHLDIVLPHHPEYTALAGETGPLPRRVWRFPSRLRREGPRWIPLDE